MKCNQPFLSRLFLPQCIHDVMYDDFMEFCCRFQRDPLEVEIEAPTICSSGWQNMGLAQNRTATFEQRARCLCVSLDTHSLAITYGTWHQVLPIQLLPSPDGSCSCGTSMGGRQLKWWRHFTTSCPRQPVASTSIMGSVVTLLCVLCGVSTCMFHGVLPIMQNGLLWA